MEVLEQNQDPSIWWLECMDMLQEISKEEHMLQKTLLNTSK